MVAIPILLPLVKLQWFSRLSQLGLQGKELVLTGHLKYIPQKVRVTQHPDHLEDAHPRKPLPL